jgi:3-methyladenine DNA glycosylase AlkD
MGVTGASQVEKIVRHLKSRASAANVAGMRRFGISGGNMLGISVTELRNYAKEIGKNHSLALALWKTGIHEARLFATLVDIPESVTEAQAERWAKTFDSWDIVDLCCNNLPRETPFAHDKCVEWSGREEEFVKRAGFALKASLAAGD